MMQRNNEQEQNNRTTINWLFAPFRYISGEKALIVGLIAIFAAGAIGSLTHTHFDGVLDVHTGRPAPLWIFLFQGVINWLVMSILFLIGGMIVMKTRFRLIDLFGYQALARFPTFIIAALTLLPGYYRYAMHLAAQISSAIEPVEVSATDSVVFGIVGILIIIMVVWMIVLMYNGFSIACNVRGGWAIGVFIVAILIGEAISNVIFIQMIGGSLTFAG